MSINHFTHTLRTDELRTKYLRCQHDYYVYEPFFPLDADKAISFNLSLETTFTVERRYLTKPKETPHSQHATLTVNLEKTGFFESRIEEIAKWIRGKLERFHIRNVSVTSSGNHITLAFTDITKDFPNQVVPIADMITRHIQTIHLTDGITTPSNAKPTTRRRDPRDLSKRRHTKTTQDPEFKIRDIIQTVESEGWTADADEHIAPNKDIIPNSHEEALKLNRLRALLNGPLEP